MEENKNYSLGYHGKGIDLFKIQIVNLILSIVTLGLYYPWAKARTLSYLYNQTTFEDSPFSFTGTGNQMFRGFIKALLFIIAFYAIFGVLVFMHFFGLGILFLYAGILGVMPLIIHGSYKYRMAKTIWRGIRFGYTGDRSELVKLFFKGVLLTIVTFGIYGAWFLINLRKYVITHIKVGNASFTYNGDGGDYFLLNLKGYFLTLFTLGIYGFWWQKNIFNFFVNNLELVQEDKKITFHSIATGGKFAGLIIVNLLIIIFTLGIGISWAVTRTLHFIAENIVADGDYSFEQLQQAQPDYSDATGADMADFFDFGFVI